MTGRVHDRSCGQSDSDSRDPAETANSPTSHGMEADHRRADIRARRVGRPCCSRERHQCQSGVGMAPPPCARPANGRCDSRRNAAGCRQRTVSAVDGARGADCDRQHTVRLDRDSAWQDVDSHRRRAGPGRAAFCSRSHFTMIGLPQNTRIWIAAGVTARPRPYWLSAIRCRRSSFLRSGMWCASNPRHAWLSDRFARGLVRASCLCYFQGVVHFGPTRDLRCKQGWRRRDGRRWNSAIAGVDDCRHERRTSRHCRRLAASRDRRNPRDASR
ncbi:hypothetical protein SAMN02787148_102239 [Burkholderia vietnamiensis]|nr:hypothetical protein EC918_103106 [Burkholderia vietnamiensis]SCZ21272.1 hypothetical protein SAMN02787148_102239 [Burkholderia vietnamiensis]SFX12432.1 hypothetical protein SAMN02787160_102105 [Burkholderia vietnamiensis]